MKLTANFIRNDTKSKQPSNPAYYKFQTGLLHDGLKTAGNRRDNNFTKIDFRNTWVIIEAVKSQWIKPILNVGFAYE